MTAGVAEPEDREPRSPYVSHHGPQSKWAEPGIIKLAREQRGPRDPVGGHYDLCNGTDCPCFQEGAAQYESAVATINTLLDLAAAMAKRIR